MNESKDDTHVPDDEWEYLLLKNGAERMYDENVPDDIRQAAQAELDALIAEGDARYPGRPRLLRDGIVVPLDSLEMSATHVYFPARLEISMPFAFAEAGSPGAELDELDGCLTEFNSYVETYELRRRVAVEDYLHRIVHGGGKFPARSWLSLRDGEIVASSVPPEQ